jgi:hypothetical protein
MNLGSNGKHAIHYASGVTKSTVKNKVTIQNFEVVPDTLNVDKICT